MKKVLLITLALIFIFGATEVFGQKVKVIDSSSKKTPSWVDGSEQDYIITSALAGDVETAKAEAMENVRRQIIRAVAENVSFETSSTINQTSGQGGIEDFADRFTSFYQTQSADVPFVQGISQSKISDFYWEKRQDKKTKQVTVLYAIKYPLPSVELKKMVNDFEKRDREMSGKYDNLYAKLDKVESLEEIDAAILELNTLKEYFFDATRKTAAENLQRSYRDLYSGVSFRTLSHDLGEYRFCMVLQGRPISTSQRMTAKSDDTYDIAVETSGTEILVGYRYDGAEYNLPGNIAVTTKIGGKSVKHEFTFVVRRGGVSIYPAQPAYITFYNAADTDRNGKIEIRMPIKSQSGERYTVCGLTLDAPCFDKPLFVDDMNAALSGKESTLVFDYDGDTRLKSGFGDSAAQATGKLNVRTADGMLNTVSFSIMCRVSIVNSQ